MYELATVCFGRHTDAGHMTLTGSRIRKCSIHMLMYIIHLRAKTCTAGTDSRILRFADS